MVVTCGQQLKAAFTIAVEDLLLGAREASALSSV
jgi:hypothetical protein